jgi:hypothetical protein
MRAIVGILVSLVCAACQVTDSKPDSYITRAPDEFPRKFVLLNADRYQGEMTLQFAKQGFQVKPISIREDVIKLLDDKTIVQYREAGYRYGIRLDIVDNPNWQCVFSVAHFIEATMTVIDITDNETIAVIKQSGPYAECPPLTPVWPLLAKDLAEAFKKPAP